MHAYLNKNTFSRVTDKPPEENRQNWNDIINKGSGNQFGKKGDNSYEDPVNMKRKQAKTKQMNEENDITDAVVPSCKKCNENGHFTYECMNTIKVSNDEVKTQTMKQQMNDLYSKIEESKNLRKKIKKDKKTKSDKREKKDKKYKKDKKLKKEKKHKKDK